ncbi:flavoprotein [Micromonospora sp. CV4]|uniref:flavoprotein n=1 Tax=Micromonospora sp. CV4 TaxID=2478711 RepID=UPI000EF506D8|nr:flavoprotein [Micromonospora sp. CV4]RLP94970.1 flavoprotein [Micromonospora sp. CV4]
MTDEKVLYLVVCAAPPALQIGELIDLLMADGWAVCVIATPMAATWIDMDVLSGQTGYPVRSEWRRPGEPDVLPKADAVVVAPATFNTINKWALGISDNLALGILNEALGLRLPVWVLPYAKPALAAHPAFTRNLDQLQANGVAVAPADEFQASNHERPPWLSLVKAMER